LLEHHLTIVHGIHIVTVKKTNICSEFRIRTVKLYHDLYII